VPSNPDSQAGTACNQGGGAVCDGSGACVECTESGHCPPGEACVGNTCEPAATCSDGLQNGGEVGIDCGGPCPACLVLLLAGGASDMVGAAYDGGAWTVTTLAGITQSGVALAVTAAGEGVGLMRRVGDDQLRYTTWSAGAWAPFAQVNFDTTRGTPSISAGGGDAQAVFHGSDYQFYATTFSGGAWSPTAAVGSYGPDPGAITARGADATFAFMNGAQGNHLYVRDRTGGAWQPEQPIAMDTNFNVEPAIVTLSSSPDDLLVVYVASANSELRYLTRTGGAWSLTAPIPSALTNHRVSLAALPGGTAIAAFRGLDNRVYATLYTGSAWSVPAVVDSLMTTAAVPAVTAGVGPALAELAFLDPAAVVRHSRLIGGAWTAPAIVGGAGMAGVAIARAP
jgi:hypothetical protein